MSNSIEFRNFTINPGEITFDVIRNDDVNSSKEDTVFFKLNHKVKPGNDYLSVALATLCGQKYQHIKIDLKISKKTLSGIEGFTKANVDVLAIIEQERENNNNVNIILNFSGGMDSLAALYLLPEDIKLCTMQFDGVFERETQFFKEFSPYIVKTNLRDKEIGLNKNSDTFMGISSILYGEYLNAGYVVFGQILEACPYLFKERRKIQYLSQFSRIFSNCNSKVIPLTHGLAEMATAKIVCHYGLKYIQQCLESLAPDGSEKRLRKEILVDIICKKYKYPFKVKFSKPPRSKYKFGTNRVHDLICLYVMKNAGQSTAELLSSDIPQEAVALCNDLQLDFFERLHCAPLTSDTFVNDDFRSEFVSKAIAAGVYPYDAHDYKEFRTVSDFLYSFY